jgi:hypothetical protein
MIAVSAYPNALIDSLLDWCAVNAEVEALAVTCIGLSYGFGLNEHQIAAARVRSSSAASALEFPLARRAAELPQAEKRIVAIDEPDWLRKAVARLAADTPAGGLLLPSASPIGIPRAASSVRATVAQASDAATGYRLTCTRLARSRLAAGATQGHTFTPYRIGYARSWEARLVGCRPVPHVPVRR